MTNNQIYKMDTRNSEKRSRKADRRKHKELMAKLEKVLARKK